MFHHLTASSLECSNNGLMFYRMLLIDAAYEISRMLFVRNLYPYTTHVFWSKVSKCVTHLADSFRMPNPSVTILCIRSFKVCTMLVISLSFNR